ncbi:MAG: NADPH-dependent F420 reductase [Propioniciclava sp.]
MDVSEPLGIVGVGKLGAAIGRLAQEAGRELWVSDRQDVPMLDLVVAAVLPGAHLVEIDALLEATDLVVAAVPQPALADLPVERMGSRILVDATNAWAATDGDTARPHSTADLLARNPHLRPVKSLNHLAYADLTAQARQGDHGDRLALAVAGDDREARQQVARLVSDVGFDAVEVGLADAWMLEPSGPLFGRHLTHHDLAAEMAAARQRGWWAEHDR